MGSSSTFRTVAGNEVTNRIMLSASSSAVSSCDHTIHERNKNGNELLGTSNIMNRGNTAIAITRTECHEFFEEIKKLSVFDKKPDQI